MGATQVIDTEYGFRGGDHDCESRFEPVVFCAIDVDTGERFHTWGRDAELRDWLNEHRGDCFVAHHAIAEMKYLLRLGIDLPERWYDTMIAYRYATNSIRRLPAGLDKALRQEGLDEWIPDNKKSLQVKIGCLEFDGNSPEELREIVRYCYQDCEATAALYARIKDRVSETWLQQWLPFIKATARMELRGIPFDHATYHKIERVWPSILARQMDEANEVCPGLYVGSTFKFSKLVAWAKARGINWPVKTSVTTGQLIYCERDDTFSDMSERHEFIRQVREIQKGRKIFGKRTMAVDDGNRSHYYGSVIFGTTTSRNTNPRFIFGGPKWMRYLIVPPSPDHVIIAVDFVAEEFGIAAALSGDAAMVETYKASDCHMEFAIRAGVAAAGATKHTHPEIRKLYKTCNLAVLFGQGAYGMAQRLGIPVSDAQQILNDHRSLYPRFWDWSERVVEGAYNRREVNTRHGWRMKVPPDSKDTVLRNWPIQATGGDILRFVVSSLEYQNVSTRASIHDGFLATCLRDQVVLDEAGNLIGGDLKGAFDFACQTATDLVLPGFPMRWDYSVFQDRYRDEDGVAQWNEIQGWLEHSPAKAVCRA